ncbi:GspH/FimT family pseudopilin [Thalassotalea sp. PLHSN55]|uniref:GspH/FimT family pseudopilin n=1 Tax=Thalassotalea sp. PLHSN55 TaxID=3435888 RepID=UPI003F85FC59
MLNKKSQLKTRQKNQGFTLVELMVGIAIVAILAAVALPSLNNLLVGMRVDGQISEMQRLLLTARNIAINTDNNTSVCPLNSDEDACSGSNNWSGIIGVLNVDGVIKTKSAINTGDQLVFNTDSVVYAPTGQTVGDSTGTFRYCPNGYADENRGIDVSSSGRTYTSADTDNDGKDENRSGDELTCS